MLLSLLILFIAIQLIQPARNNRGQILAADLTKIYVVPEKVLSVLQNSCYDCHSNHTRYPWYANIQPGSWLMAHHIKEAKADLNFSEFGKFSIRRQQSKLQAIANSIEDGTMPLCSYAVIHTDAKLSGDQKSLIFDWIKITKDSLSLIGP